MYLKPQTMNPNPWLIDRDPYTPNPVPLNQKPWIFNPKPCTLNLEP